MAKWRNVSQLSNKLGNPKLNEGKFSQASAKLGLYFARNEKWYRLLFLPLPFGGLVGQMHNARFEEFTILIFGDLCVMTTHNHTESCCLWQDFTLYCLEKIITTSDCWGIQW